jgi:hypothetical protein
MSMLAAAVGLVLLAGPSAAAATPPAEFGTDWHDPITAAPPVSTPVAKSCTTQVADAQSRDFTGLLASKPGPGGKASAAQSPPPPPTAGPTTRP